MCYDCSSYTFGDGCRLAEADNSVIGISSKECEHYRDKGVICDPRLNGRSRKPWPHRESRFPEFVCSHHEQLLREGKEVTPDVYPGIKSWIFNGDNAKFIKDETLRRTLQEEIHAKQMIYTTSDFSARTFKPTEPILSPAVQRRTVVLRGPTQGLRQGMLFWLPIKRS